MANKVTDHFNANQGELSVTTPDVGHTWAKIVGAADKKLEAWSGAPYNNQVLQNGTTVRVQYQTNSLDDCATDEHDVTCDIKPANSTTNKPCILARGNRTDGNYYKLLVTSDGTNHDQELLKVVSGTSTSLGTYTTGTIPKGNMATYKLQIRTAAKKIFANGAEVISSTDDSLTGKKAGGIESTSNDQSERWDDFFLDEAPVAEGPDTMYQRRVIEEPILRGIRMEEAMVGA